MINSISGASVSGGSSAEIHSDKTRDNYGMGENLVFNTNSTNNIAIGEDALNSTGNAAHYNIALGTEALTANATGDGNVGIGHGAGKMLVTGINNVIIGYGAMDAAAGSEEYNVVIGSDAMGAVDEGTGGGSANSNIAIGHEAAKGADFAGANRSFIGHVAIGHQALATGSTTTSTTGNVAIGYQALTASEGVGGQVAIGYQAGKALTDGVANLAIGYNAMLEHTTGGYNIAIGYGAMDDTGANDCPESTDNVFIGYHSGGGTWTTDDSNYNVGVGNYTMDFQMNGAIHNSALGYHALGGITSGTNNTALGSNAGLSVSTGINNTFVGSGCGDAVTTTNNNTAVGYAALSAGAGVGNTAMGYSAGTNLTSGTYNTAIGYNAMQTSAATHNAVAIGSHALYSASADDTNGTVAIGQAAAYKYAPTSGGTYTGASTIIGYHAGYDDTGAGGGLTTGIQNTAVGHETLGANAGDGVALTGSGNTVMGYRAGYGLNGSSSYNTLIGRQAGDAVTTGAGNTAVGYNADVPAQGTYQTAIGYAAVSQNNNETRVGMHGGFQFYSREITCDLGGGAENDPAHATPIGKIPRYAVITRATAVVIGLSSDANHTLKLVLATDGTGADNTALSGVQEVIGAGASNSWSSTGAAGAAADINVASGAVEKTAYTAIPYDPAGATDSGLAALDTTGGDLSLYLAFADTNYTNGDSSNPSTAPIVRVYIEFAGQD